MCRRPREVLPPPRRSVVTPITLRDGHEPSAYSDLLIERPQRLACANQPTRAQHEMSGDLDVMGALFTLSTP